MFYLTLIGTKENPIVIGAYGAGNKPVFLGDFRRATWLPTERDSIWKMYVGYIWMANESYEYYNNDWHALTLKGGYGSVGEKAAWLATLAAGQIGPTITAVEDTLYYHTHDGLAPDTSWLTLYGHMLMTGSKNVIVRDLHCEGGHGGIYVYHCDSVTVRNLYTKHIMKMDIETYGGTGHLVDSCYSDSSACTPFYNFISSYNVFRYDTAHHVNRIAYRAFCPINTKYQSANEVCGVGMQGCDTAAWVSKYPGTTPLGTHNIYEHIFLDDIEWAGFDAFWNQEDTIRYNRVVNSKSGFYVNGKNVVNHDNYFSSNSVSGGIGVQVNGHGGTNRVYNDTLIGVDYGLSVTTTDGGALTSFHDNDVTGSASTDPLSNFVTAGVTSIDNTFHSPGRFREGSNYYSTLTLFQATGYEVGSVMDASPQTVIAVVSGDDQGYLATIKSDSLIVIVTVGGNPVEDVFVTFSIISYPQYADGYELSSGGGYTDIRGKVGTILTLGDVVGDYIVTATLAGATGSPLTFTVLATGLIGQPYYLIRE
jgi:hypothetical protein